MKKIAFTFLLIAGLVTLCSCTRKSDYSSNSEHDGVYIYPFEEYQDFYVADDGSLYYCVFDDAGGETSDYTDSSALKAEEPNFKSKIYRADLSGEVKESYILDEYPIIKLAGDQERAFYVIEISDNEDESLHTHDSAVISFNEYVYETGAKKEIYKLTGVDYISQMVVVGDFIYFIGIDHKRLNKEYSLANSDDYYYYSGEFAGVIDINNKSMLELDIEFPVAISKTSDGRLLLYAYDQEKGYYFIEYDKQDTVSDKLYHNLRKLAAFAVYNDNEDIIYSDINTSPYCLSAAALKEGKGTIEMMPYVYANKIECRGDYIYYANIMNSNRIERIKYKDYIQSVSTIKMLSSTFYTYTPFGCGYKIEKEYPSMESFALSVLSYDDSYDFYLIDSRQDISENIKNKGAFYPLNDVSGVKEYLDACFPYVKDAATTAEGDIWMLPIQIDIPCLIYSEENCRKYGIDFSAQADIYSFLDRLALLEQNKDAENKYEYSNYIITETVLHQYLRENKTFDSQLFRKLAPLLKEHMNYIRVDSNRVSAEIVANMLMSKETESFIFSLVYGQAGMIDHALNNNLRVCGLPGIYDSNTNIARSIFICVNPYSKNIKTVLNYISSLCNYLMENNEYILFKDRARYPDNQTYNDLYNIYSNAEIVFTLPNDVFINDFEKYLADEIDLEKLIAEADRKLDTFLNE